MSFVYKPLAVDILAAHLAVQAPLARKWKGLCLHHTYIPSQELWEQWGKDSRKTIKSIWNTHVEEYGWSDIGYNFIILPDGMVASCRPLSKEGGHAMSWNDDTIGVALIGNFDKGNEQPTAAQIRSFVVLAKLLADRFKFDLSLNFATHGKGLGFHRDEPNALRIGKTCPGTGVSWGMVQSWLKEKTYQPESDGDPEPLDVAPWAQSAVDEVMAEGIMVGRSKTRFAGTEFITRQEIAVVVSRIMAWVKRFLRNLEDRWS